MRSLPKKLRSLLFEVGRFLFQVRSRLEKVGRSLFEVRTRSVAKLSLLKIPALGELAIARLWVAAGMITSAIAHVANFGALTVYEDADLRERADAFQGLALATLLLLAIVLDQGARVQHYLGSVPILEERICSLGIVELFYTGSSQMRGGK
jgi:hypothetical protein